MKCPKCKGLMNFETFINIERESMPWSYEGFRWIDCGEILDPIILKNRKQTQTQEQKRKKKEMVGIRAIG